MRCWRCSPGARGRRSCSSANFGSAYTARIIDVPASTGYGEPVQSLFKFKDGERVVAAASLDPRVATAIAAKKEGDAPPTHAVAVTTDGYSLRFSLEPFVEVSTRTGRRFARVGDGAEVVGVSIVQGIGSADRRDPAGSRAAVQGRRSELPLGPGRGVILIKLDKDDDSVLGFVASSGDRDLLTVETTRGASQTDQHRQIQPDQPRRTRT